MVKKLLIQVPQDDEYLKNYYENLKIHHKGDAGLDLIIPENVEIYPFQMKMVSLKIKTCLIDKENTENTYSYFVLPRSSIAKTGLIMANSVGLIDAPYRGEIQVPLIYMPRYSTAHFVKGTTFTFIIFSILNYLKSLISEEYSFISIIALILAMIYALSVIFKDEDIGTPYKLLKGERIVQLCSADLESNIETELVDTLPETTRGSGGFGSTGR